MPPRVLFVADSETAHTPGWVGLCQEIGLDVAIFHLGDRPVSPALQQYRLYSPGDLRNWPGSFVQSIPSRRLRSMVSHLAGLVTKSRQVLALRRVMAYEKPDIVHSLRFQNEAYVTMAAMKMGKPCRWLVSVWGSDFVRFMHRPVHRVLIRQVLRACDGCIVDCQRDAKIAIQLGLPSERILGVFPVNGGLDGEKWKLLRQSAPSPDQRRLILVPRGGSGFYYVPEVLISALEQCAPLLDGYRVVILGASRDIKMDARRLQDRYGICIEALDRVPHEQVVRYVLQARLCVSPSLSDGTPVSLLEAMAAGALPIYTDMESIREIIEPGRNGLLAQPDRDAFAAAIQQGITDDSLVCSAAEQNWQFVQEHMTRDRILPQVARIYGVLQ